MLGRLNPLIRATTSRYVGTYVNAIQSPSTGKILVQTPLPPINCLALEGGGIPCFPAYLGFFKIMMASGIMKQVDHIAGTSGGAICALVSALGYSALESESILLNINMTRFLEKGHSALAETGLFARSKLLVSILRSENFSLTSGNEFLEWLRDIVEKKMGNRHATFGDLAKCVEAGNLSGEHLFKYLYVTGTNLSLELPECVFFSHEYDPTMELALGVYISGCYPGVFPLAKYKGFLWGDGGLVRNLPSKIFDDKRFLPPGYGFNEKGLNPGVLVVKVDSKAEANQILWGIIKEVDLSSASNVVAALYNALTQNTDTQEIRDSRMAIALPNNNIGVLEFTVDNGGKIGLISSAERETLDFVENYYHAAYDMKVYNNIMDWLESLSLDEIDDVKMAYEKMLQVAIEMPISTLGKEKNKDSIISSPQLIESEQQQPSALELKEYIIFLDAYYQYRRAKKRNETCVFTLQPPLKHINLGPKMDASGWNAHVEFVMTEKLRHVKSQIEHVRNRITTLEIEFMNLQEISAGTMLHDDVHFDNIQAITIMAQYLQILLEEKKELQIKLGIFKSDSKIDNDTSVRYAGFIKHLTPLLNSSSLHDDLKNVLVDQFPIYKFASTTYTRRGVVLQINLHEELDRRIYILAALFFLNAKKSFQKAVYQNMYSEHISKEMPLPRNMKELGLVLKLDDVELLMAAYRIEELIHHFEKNENPKRSPKISLDVIFGLSQKKEVMQAPKGQEVQMKHIVHTNSLFNSVMLPDISLPRQEESPPALGSKSSNCDGQEITLSPK